MFAVMLSLILFWILFTFAWIWRDARRLRRKIERDNEKMRRATAESMVTYMARKKSRSRRHQLPKEMTKVHERWAEKKDEGLPPRHGSKGRIIKTKTYTPPRRTGIPEDPVREARYDSKAVYDPTPHPRARPEITPDMVTRRSSEPELHDVEVDIMGEPACFSGAPRRVAALPPIAEGEEVLIPEPLTLAIARRESVSEDPLPGPAWTWNKWNKSARSGSTEPSTGQLPPVPKKKKQSSSRVRSPSAGSATSAGSAGSASSAAQVAVDPNTGAATWHAKPKP